MKILYLVHCFYPEHHGGTEKFVLQLAQQCQSAGHTVKVVTYDSRKPSPPHWVKPKQTSAQRLLSVLHKTARQLGLNRLYWQASAHFYPNPLSYRSYVYADVPVLAFAYQRKRRPAPYQLSAQRDQRLLRFAEAILTQERPDLIHVGYLPNVIEFLHVASALKIPYLVTLTDYLLLCARTLLVNQSQALCQGPRAGEECRVACSALDQTLVRQRYGLSQHLLTQAQAVIAPSLFLAKLFQKEWPTLPIQFIPYGIEKPALPARQCSYTNGAPLIFFFAGRLDEAKGVALLLRAFRQLQAANIRLEIYGSGHLEPEVRQAAAEDPRICFGGVYTNNELGALLRRVDVVVVPSTWYENLPFIVQEAQARGVPTLVADVGGMTECVTDGVNGFTFRVGDGADLQRKLQMIIDQPESLNVIKETIRNPGPGQYQITSLGNEAAMYLEQYEKILTGKS